MSVRLGPLLAETPLGMGVLGAIVSGSNAAAQSIEGLRSGKSSRIDAGLHIGNEAMKSAVVSATGAVIVTGLGGGFLASLTATLVIGTIGKYAWDRGSQPSLARRRSRRKKFTGRGS